MKLFFTFILLLYINLSAQVIDTTSSPFPDSLTVAHDTSSVIDSLKKKNFDVDDIIYSSGNDSLIFKISKKQMEIYGNGELKYKQSDLKSENILVDFNTNQIHATGVVDSSDSLKGAPVLTEGTESYTGSKLTYNFKTQRGFISLARTETDGTVYSGEKVKKLDKQNYFVEDGIYTTCTADTPHYHFSAQKMKVILKQQIIAKWIWFNIADIPLPIPLPFGAFPTQSGRRSGIIAPAYGQRQGQGYYFSHFGYFWAINDYLDANLMMDYFLRGGYNLNSRLRYALRYNLSGSVDVTYSHLNYNVKGDDNYREQKDWRIAIYHNQNIDPSTTLNANLNFVSSQNLYTNTSVNYNDLLQQNITSSATFFKSWEESGNSLSINYSRNQYLSTGDYTEILPSATFSMNQKYPFKRSGDLDVKNQSWYEKIGVSYSANLENQRMKEKGHLDIRGGLQHNASVNASPKVGYFSIAPSINYIEKWYNKRIRKHAELGPNPDDSTKTIEDIIDEDVKEYNMIRTFNFALSASTRLYGIIQPNALGVESFRHTINPSISYVYQPDFSDDKWGYYDYYTDTKGKRVKYDKYGSEVFGGVGGGEQQAINFSVGNVFEIKTIKDPTDTTSEQKKIQLLNLTAGVGYNFAADSVRLSDLRLSYRTQIGDLLSFNGSSSYTFYHQEGARKFNKLLMSEGRGLFRLTNFSFSLSTSLSADKFKSTKKKPEPVDEGTENAFQRSENSSLYREEEPDFSIPWDLSLNYNYNLNKSDANNPRPTSNLNASMNVNLTKSWKLSLMGSYDFINKEILAPQIRIFKDLHCWEMNITWNPIGPYRGYRFEIRIKASQLQDIKVTRARGQFSGRGY